MNERAMSRRDCLTFGMQSAAVGLLAISGPEGLMAQVREKARPLNLKITDLKTFVVNTGNTNFVFVKIYTNQGIVGLGEGSITSTSPSSRVSARRTIAGTARPEK